MIDDNIVSDAALVNLIISAFEGGSNYWIGSVTRNSIKAKEGPWYACPHFWQNGGEAVIQADEESPDYSGTLTLPALREALEAIPRHHLADIIAENDDADTADVILQQALFGEVVFG